MITINGINLTDNINFLVEEITYRNLPSRHIVSLPLSTRPGEKLITTEWGTKQITIKGRVFTTTSSGILPIIDILQQNMSAQSAALVVDTGRTYTVNLSKLDIPNQFYQVTMAEFTAAFEAIDPFSYGASVTVSGTVPSGTATFSGSVTISGTVFAQPVLTLTPTAGGALAGDAGFSQFAVEYMTTTEMITVSGTNSSNFQNGVAIGIDYNNFITTISGVSVDYTGVFSRWEPGVRNFQITIPSGTKNTYKWQLQYQPRYYE